jgi:hypothetical protein
LHSQNEAKPETLNQNAMIIKNLYHDSSRMPKKRKKKEKKNRQQQNNYAGNHRLPATTAVAAAAVVLLLLLLLVLVVLLVLFLFDKVLNHIGTDGAGHRAGNRAQRTTARVVRGPTGTGTADQRGTETALVRLAVGADRTAGAGTRSLGGHGALGAVLGLGLVGRGAAVVVGGVLLLLVGRR